MRAVGSAAAGAATLLTAPAIWRTKKKRKLGWYRTLKLAAAIAMTCFDASSDVVFIVTDTQGAYTMACAAFLGIAWLYNSVTIVRLVRRGKRQKELDQQLLSASRWQYAIVAVVATTGLDTL